MSSRRFKEDLSQTYVRNGRRNTPDRRLFDHRLSDTSFIFYLNKLEFTFSVIRVWKKKSNDIVIKMEMLEMYYFPTSRDGLSCRPWCRDLEVRTEQELHLKSLKSYFLPTPGQTRTFPFTYEMYDRRKRTSHCWGLFFRGTLSSQTLKRNELVLSSVIEGADRGLYLGLDVREGPSYRRTWFVELKISKVGSLTEDLIDRDPRLIRNMRTQLIWCFLFMYWKFERL